MKVRNRRLNGNRAVPTTNPFVSEAQRRACYAADDPDWDCSEWEARTPKGKKLPERKPTHNRKGKGRSRNVATSRLARGSGKASRIDPTNTITLRRQFLADFGRRLALLRGRLFKLLVRDNALGLPQGDEGQPARNVRIVNTCPPTTNAIHEFSTVQLDLPPELASRVRSLGRRIAPSDLSATGREDNPHITVRYGLHGQNPTAVRKLLAGTNSVTATLGNVTVFRGAGEDVVVIAVEGDDLHRLHRKLAALPHTDTHPAYRPHITLAYVKPGRGRRYAGRCPLTGERVTFRSATFGNRDGERTHIPLTEPTDNLATLADALLTLNHTALDMHTVAVDFDRTITKKSLMEDVPLADVRPRPGVRRALKRIQQAGVRVMIHTANPDHSRVRAWLDQQDVPYDDLVTKIPAAAYIDDRGVTASKDRRWDELADEALGHVFGEPRQPLKDGEGWSKLSELAAAAQRQLVKFLATLDLRLLRIDKLDLGDLETRLNRKGTVAVLPPLKARERATEKVEADYDGDWSKLLDVVRASIVCDTLPEMRRAYRTFLQEGRKAGVTLARAPKDRFRQPLGSGYRDLLTNWKLPSGFIVEVQFHVKPMFVAREKERLAYDVVRSVIASLETEGREDMTPAEAEVVRRIRDGSKRLYGKAWEEIKRDSGITGNAAIGNTHKLSPAERMAVEGSPEAVYYDPQSGTPYLTANESFFTTCERDEHGRCESGEAPLKTGNVDKALRALAAGRKVVLKQRHQVSTLLDRLSALVKEAAAKGEKAPVINLCDVSVKGTNLFCSESKGIPRLRMPQLKGIPTPGSTADHMEKDAKGKVDVAHMFVADLRTHGTDVEDGEEDAAYLRASQAELDGVKAARMLKRVRKGEPQPPIVVSRDNYIVDGHHHWAGLVAHELEGKDKVIVPIRRVDMDILELLERANKYAAKMGIASEAMTGNALLHNLVWDESKVHRDESGRFGGAGTAGHGTVTLEQAKRDYAAHGTKARAFKNWFGDWEADPSHASKVVDDKGAPQQQHKVKEVFHGTTGHFSAFDPEKVGRHGMAAGSGFYFAEDERIAEEYTKGYRSPGGSGEKVGHTIRAYLNIRNPLDYDSHVTTKDQDKWAEAAASYTKGITEPHRGGPWFDKEEFGKQLATARKFEGGKGGSLTAGTLWNALDNCLHAGDTNKVIAALGYDGITHRASDVYGSPALPDGPAKYGRCWIAFAPEQIKAVQNRGTFDPHDTNIHNRRVVNADCKPGQRADTTGCTPASGTSTPSSQGKGAEEQAKGILSRWGGKIGALADRVPVVGQLKRGVATVMGGIKNTLAQRYGDKAANVIMASGSLGGYGVMAASIKLLGFTVPFVTDLVSIAGHVAVAEGLYQLGVLKGKQPTGNADVGLTPEQLQQLSTQVQQYLVDQIVAMVGQNRDALEQALQGEQGVLTDQPVTDRPVGNVSWEEDRAATRVRKFNAWLDAQINSLFGNFGWALPYLLRGYVQGAARSFDDVNREEGKHALTPEEYKGAREQFFRQLMSTPHAPTTNAEQPRDEKGQFAKSAIVHGPSGSKYARMKYPDPAVEYVPIDKMFEHGEAGSLSSERNSPAALKALADSLEKEGYRQPLHMTQERRKVNEYGKDVPADPETARTYLTDGRHRLEAAKRAGHTHVPVKVNRGEGKVPGRFSSLRPPTTNAERRYHDLRDVQGKFISEKAKLLGQRLFQEMKGVTQYLVQQLSRVITDGVQFHRSPAEVVDAAMEKTGLARTRAEAVVHTEITRAHAEGQLDGMEALGVSHVKGVAEWHTAEDSHVCELCSPMEGVVLSVAEARGLIPRHVRCRCRWSPASKGDPDTQVRTRRGIRKAVKESVNSDLSGTWPGEDLVGNSVTPLVGNYVPDQPRDEHGRFSTGGHEATGLSHRVRKAGGFTYKPLGSRSPKSGFIVSLSREAGWEKPLTDEEFQHHGRRHLRAYLEKVRDAIKAGKLDPAVAHVGAWHDTSTGRVVLDVNEVYPDREEAIRVGRQRKQDAIFDLGGLAEIDLRKPGQRTNAPAPTGNAGAAHGHGNGFRIGRIGPEDLGWLEGITNERPGDQPRDERGRFAETSSYGSSEAHKLQGGQLNQAAGRAWAAGLDGGHEHALNDWIDGKHQEMRKRIAAGKADWKDKALLESLKDAPQYAGPAYRGIPAKGDEPALDQFKEGSEWVDHAPHSLSTLPHEGTRFAESPPAEVRGIFGSSPNPAPHRGVLLSVRSKSARSIAGYYPPEDSPAAGNASEGEVVGLPGTRYRVHRIQRNVTVDDGRGKKKVAVLVEMEEL